MKLHYYQKTLDDEPELVSLRNAKKMLKEHGGTAWTDHIDRSGTMFESTPIQLGNNGGSSYGCRYNRKL